MPSLAILSGVLLPSYTRFMVTSHHLSATSSPPTCFKRARPRYKCMYVCTHVSDASLCDHCVKIAKAPATERTTVLINVFFKLDCHTPLVSVVTLLTAPRYMKQLYTTLYTALSTPLERLPERRSTYPRQKTCSQCSIVYMYLLVFDFCNLRSTWCGQTRAYIVAARYCSKKLLYGVKLKPYHIASPDTRVSYIC